MPNYYSVDFPRLDMANEISFITADKYFKLLIGEAQQKNNSTDTLVVPKLGLKVGEKFVTYKWSSRFWFCDRNT